MSTEQDFLAQTLVRITRQPSAGAGLSTDIMATADALVAGVSAQVLLAPLGNAQALPPHTVSMAGSEYFEFNASVGHIQTHVWEVDAAESLGSSDAYVAHWSSLGLRPGDLAIFSDEMKFASVSAISSISIAGSTYAKVSFDTDIQLPSNGLESMTPSQKAGVSKLTSLAADPFTNSLILDGVYPALRRGDIVLVEYSGVPYLREIQAIKVVQVTTDVNAVGGDTQAMIVPATWVEFKAFALHPDWVVPEEYIIHYNLVRAGRIFPAPADTITATAFESGSPVTGPGVGPQGKYAIVGADGKAAIFEGAVLPSGDELKFLATNFLQGDTTYKLPAKLYGPLVEATRGETVKAEVLGSGDATIPFQSFTLRKSPLTYVADPSAPNGRRSTLSVSVNGKKWRQAQSFYGTTSTDQIYVVTHDADNKTTITFGDGEFGARLPTGVDNVVASYRHGVGGNVAANAINAFKKPVKGIKKVFNPLPASGGEDPPTPAEAREKGIQSTRVLGRLVSLLDFEVEAARYGGVMQARASWAWDPQGDDAAAHVWVVTADDGDPSEALRCYLLGLAEPDVQVVVRHAKPLVGAFELDLELDPAYQPAAVSKAVLEHLFHPFDGFFALRNVGIGGYLHRSRLYAAIHAVEGVLGVNDVMVNKASMPMAIKIDEGHYLDLLDEPISVNGVLFSANVDGEVTILPPNLTLPVPPPAFTKVAWVGKQWLPAEPNTISNNVAPGKGALLVNLANVQIIQPYKPLGMLE